MQEKSFINSQLGIKFNSYIDFFFLLTEIFITTTSLTTLSLQNLRLQKITIKN